MADLLKKSKTSIGGPVLYKNFIKNWIHQAVTYMDTGEKLLRLTIEFIEIILFTAIIVLLFNTSLILTFVVAFLIIHTFNWITNCLFWAVLIFAVPALKNSGEIKTVQYLKNMTQRLRKHNSVSGLAIFGSVARKKWHDRSDIDVRILRRPGIKNLLISCFLTMRERFIAFVNKQPMDLYLADDVDFLQKMRADEKPIFLIKRDSRLEKTYPGNQEQVLQKLRL